MKINRTKKILEFLEENSGIFSKYELQVIKSYIISEEYEKILFLPDGVREILDELGFLSDRQNIYQGFIDLISSSFDLEGKEIIEIGGGRFPRLGKRLSEIPGVKSVTVYDPKLNPYVSDTDKLKLVRKKIRYTDNDVGGDLIIGLMPCKGAEVVIEQALNYNHDFMVALCEGGPHGDYFDYFDNEDEWISSIMRHAELGIEKNKMGTFKVKSLIQYGDRYPVICNERI